MGPNGPASTAGIPGLGEVFAGAYRVEGVLGRGAMGMVVAAEHVSLRRSVAVKFLLPGAMRLPSGTKRFLREARAAAAIRSEHVARIIDVGVSESGLPYIVMERLKGKNLQEVLDLRGALPVAEAVGYVLQACEPLALAHALGIVHRDLKPGNLFLATDPDGAPIVKVLDFGLSKALDAEKGSSDGRLSSAAMVIGSPYYMSPEQVRSARDVDQRSDIWSLGVLLHQLLTESFPFEAPNVSALFAVIAADPPTPPRAHRSSLPEELEDVILRCLEKDVTKRIQSVAELARALAPFGSKTARRMAERVARIGRKCAMPPLSRRTPRRRMEVDPQGVTLTGPISQADSLALAQLAAWRPAVSADDGPTLMSPGATPPPPPAARPPQPEEGPTLLSRGAPPPLPGLPQRAPRPPQPAPAPPQQAARDPRAARPTPRRGDPPPVRRSSAVSGGAPITRKSGTAAMTSTVIRRCRGAAALLAFAFALVTASALAATLWQGSPSLDEPAAPATSTLPSPQEPAPPEAPRAPTVPQYPAPPSTGQAPPAEIAPVRQAMIREPSRKRAALPSPRKAAPEPKQPEQGDGAPLTILLLR